MDRAIPALRQLPPCLFGEAPVADFVERDGVFGLELQHGLIDHHLDRGVGDDSAFRPTAFAQVVAFGRDFLIYFEPS